MKLTKEQLNKIVKFAKSHFPKNDQWHQTFHAKKTVELSIGLAKKEKVDINKAIIIAWLHDISKHKELSKINHGIDAAKIAKNFLKKLEFSNKDILEICYAIGGHDESGPKKSKQAKIIWDSDKLQCVGPYGLIRNYGYQIDIGKSQKEAYETDIIEQKKIINNFYTKTARRIAKKKFKFMKKFHKHYQDISNKI